MIPDDCKGHECHYYREGRENNARWCSHSGYDSEVNQCPGWVSRDDVKYVNHDPYDWGRLEREE